MAITELERSAMVQQLTETLGQETTDTLTKCLVLDGTDQLATKSDVENLRTDFEKHRLATKADIEAASAKQTRTLLFTTLGLFTSMVGMWVPVMIGLFG